MPNFKAKLARNFHKAWSFILTSLLSALLFIESVFQFFPPETFGEIGALGWAALIALIAFVRALPQKDFD